MHGVFAAYVNGVCEKGEGGFVFVTKNKCGYMFPDDIRNISEDAANSLSKLVCKENTCFYAVEIIEKQLTVAAYHKSEIAASFIGQTQEQKPALEQECEESSSPLPKDEAASGSQTP